VALPTAGRDEALTRVRENVAVAGGHPGAAWVVLVKASRGAALESVAEGLIDDLPDRPAGEGPSR
jgi:UDP-N-acetylmuramoyl-tripeptide--D-alanyl-D-alanine ligase